MGRPERFALPTFWFGVRFGAPRTTKPQRNTAMTLLPFAPFCLTLDHVYGQKAHNPVCEINLICNQNAGRSSYRGGSALNGRSEGLVWSSGRRGNKCCDVRSLPAPPGT